MSSQLSINDTVPLPIPSNSTSSSPVNIPRLGFGVYLSSPRLCVQSCTTALNIGYRHIDTAQFYANEVQVGQAVRESGLKRSEVFVTTKILSAAGSVERSYGRCVDSVAKIAGEEDGAYVDLFLIHSPNAGSKAREEMWLALEKLYAEGKARSIGVSNYGVGHIEEMKKYASVWPPMVNQIELHPWCQQREIDSYCQKNGIVVEAYSPLVRNNKANESTLVGLAKEYGKTTAQILIRYCLQKNWVPLPKSDKPDRIKENADVYGFEIKADDMQKLDGLDQGDAGAIVQAVTNSL